MDIRNRAADVWQKIGSLIHFHACFNQLVYVTSEDTEPADNHRARRELVALCPSEDCHRGSKLMIKF